MQAAHSPIAALFVSRTDAATALANRLGSVANYIANGSLKTRKLDGRTLVPTADLLRFAALEHRSPSTSFRRYQR